MNGKPVLYMHGFPGSHKQADFLSRFCEQNNIFLIAFDRPGYGETSRQLCDKQSLSQVAVQLLDYLKIQKVSLMGISGGAPSAWQFALDYPERTNRLGIVCGLAPFTGDFKRSFPTFHKVGLNIFSNLSDSVRSRILKSVIKKGQPKIKFQLFKKILNEADRKLFDRKDLVGMLMSSLTWARNQGSLGVEYDLQTYSKDWWGSRSVQVPTHIWHGENDRINPVGMAYQWKKIFPQVDLHIDPYEGHYSILVNKHPEIFKELTKDI